MNRRILLVIVPTIVLLACGSRVLQFEPPPGDNSAPESNVDAGALDAGPEANEATPLPDAAPDTAPPTMLYGCPVTASGEDGGPICATCSYGDCFCDWTFQGHLYQINCGVEGGVGSCACNVDHDGFALFTALPTTCTNVSDLVMQMFAPMNGTPPGCGY